MPQGVVNFHRLATKDYLAAQRWYARQSERSAEAFLAELERAIERIREDPWRWSEFDEQVRWVRTRRFPYLLYYQIRDDTHVRILAVAHAHRRPGYWRRRIHS